MEQAKVEAEKMETPPITAQPEPDATMEEQERFVKQLTGTAKEELLKFGVTDKDIEEWKRRFGPVEVVFVRTDPIVYRGLNRLEWREIVAMPELTPIARLDKEEAVARKCMLFPKSQDFSGPAKAGLATLVFNRVMELSNFEPSTPAIPL